MRKGETTVKYLSDLFAKCLRNAYNSLEKALNLNPEPFISSLKFYSKLSSVHFSGEKVYDFIDFSEGLNT